MRKYLILIIFIMLNCSPGRPVRESLLLAFLTDNVVNNTDPGKPVAPVTPGVQAWSNPITLEDHVSLGGQDAFNPVAALSGQGGTIVVWEQFDGLYQRIYMSENRDGVWTHPADLNDAISPAGFHAFNPCLVMNEAGEAIIVWEQETPDGIIPYMSELRNGVWFHPPVVTPGPGGFPLPDWDQLLNDRKALSHKGILNPQVAMDPEGNVLLVWEEETLLEGKVILRRERRGGVWLDKVAVQSCAAGDTYPRAQLDEFGDGLVAWKCNVYFSNGKIKDAQINVQLFSMGRWLEIERLNFKSANRSYDLQADMKNGRAVVAWVRQVGNSSNSARETNFTDFSNGTWNSVYFYNNGGNSTAEGLSTSIDAQGHIIATWNQGTGDDVVTIIVEKTDDAWSSSILRALPKGALTGTPGYPWTAGDGKGNSMMVWVEAVHNPAMAFSAYAENEFHVYNSIYRDGKWEHRSSSGDSLSPGITDARFPLVVMNQAGDAVTVWTQSNGASDQIFVSTFRAGVE